MVPTGKLSEDDALSLIRPYTDGLVVGSTVCGNLLHHFSAYDNSANDCRRMQNKKAMNRRLFNLAKAKNFNAANQKTKDAVAGFAQLHKGDRHSARCSLALYLDSVGRNVPGGLDMLEPLLCGYSADAPGIEVVNACDTMLSDPRSKIAIMKLLEDGVLGAQKEERVKGIHAWTKAVCRSRFLKLPDSMGGGLIRLDAQGVTLCAYVIRAGGRSEYIKELGDYNEVGSEVYNRTHKEDLRFGITQSSEVQKRCTHMQMQGITLIVFVKQLSKI